MRDEYPPFRLDQGATQAEGLAEPTLVVAEAPVPVAGEPAAPATSCPQRLDRGPTAPVVVGTIGAARARPPRRRLRARRRRPDTTRRRRVPHVPDGELPEATHAIVPPPDSTATAPSGARQFLGTVRIRSESDRPVFVGIGPADDVTQYIGGVERDEVDDLDNDGDPEYSASRAARQPARRVTKSGSRGRRVPASELNGTRTAGTGGWS